MLVTRVEWMPVTVAYRVETGDAGEAIAKLRAYDEAGDAEGVERLTAKKVHFDPEAVSEVDAERYWRVEGKTIDEHRSSDASSAGREAC